MVAHSSAPQDQEDRLLATLERLERRVDVDDRMRALLRAADHLTSPRALDARAVLEWNAARPDVKVAAAGQPDRRLRMAR